MMFGRTLTDHERAAAIHHDEGPPPPRIRLMRGQVVVREETPPPSAVLWTPELGPRQVSTHRGVVLGLGPPARLTEHPSSPEVPHGFGVGDLVQYHFGAVGTQAARTRAWTDGLPATWLVQAEVDAVWEEAPQVAACPARVASALARGCDPLAIPCPSHVAPDYRRPGPGEPCVP